jgi:hypothetical protein
LKKLSQGSKRRAPCHAQRCVMQSNAATGISGLQALGVLHKCSAPHQISLGAALPVRGACKLAGKLVSSNICMHLWEGSCKRSHPTYQHSRKSAPVLEALPNQHLHPPCPYQAGPAGKAGHR